MTTGFLAWGPSIKTYRAVSSHPGFQWEADAQPALDAIRETISSEEFYPKLAALLGQESSRNPQVLELRGEHVTFMKSLGLFFFLLFVLRYI